MTGELDNPNPTGYCLCGCGEQTPISQYNDPRTGTRKGYPVRYIQGHIRRVGKPEYIVDPETGCWNWNGSMRGNGYGRIRIRYQTVPAHRYMYERLRGPIPDGLQIDHLCKNTRCVNPDHMEPVTNVINMQRRDCTKLTPDDVRQIRALRRDRVPAKIVAARFGVCEATVHSIITRKRWSSVT